MPRAAHLSLSFDSKKTNNIIAGDLGALESFVRPLVVDPVRKRLVR